MSTAKWFGVRFRAAWFKAKCLRAMNQARVYYLLVLCMGAFLPVGCNQVSTGAALTHTDKANLTTQDSGENRSHEEGKTEQRKTFKITNARWQAADKKLKVKGTGAPRSEQITVADADTGSVLGVAKIENEHEWEFEAENLEAVPCRVAAKVGDKQSQLDVKNAPGDCGDPGEPPMQNSHAGRYTTYEGSKTCNQCHGESQDVHVSVHYQWHGPTPHVVNMESGGKLGGINDFCGYPDINFIGQLTNLNGETVDGGCAVCHVGMGAKPDPEASQTQLENIDCLICHSDSYRRKVIKHPDGTFAFVPAPEKMDVPLLQAITDIRKEPTKGACVNCHSYSGGGCNNKRGDIEEAHRNPPSALFDVHMAAKEIGGAGLNCQDCHISEGHRFSGRGVDLRPTDLDVAVRCTNCHSIMAHQQRKLNDHTARIDCATCHIPVFAKISPTDMLRDFSKPPQILEEKQLYEPYFEHQNNVIPEYRFWNGLSRFYQFATPYELAGSGRVLMAGPVGDIKDPNAKIFPFKHHLAVQPYDVDTRYLLPMRMGILFQTGNVEGAIEAGAQAVGWTLGSGYDFVQTERFMGIFHEVSPADNALSCNDCHGRGSRMDFAALGYTPLPQRNPALAQNCASGCHGKETEEWSSTEFFTGLHDKHVGEEGISCSVCHNYY